MATIEKTGPQEHCHPISIQQPPPKKNEPPIVHQVKGLVGEFFDLSINSPPLSNQEISTRIISGICTRDTLRCDCALFIERLWKESHIKLQKPTDTRRRGNVELVFSQSLSPFNITTLEQILINSSISSLNQVTYIDFRKYPLLGPAAPLLLVKYCANLSRWDFDNESFYDHKILHNNKSILINKGLVASYSPYFKSLWERDDANEPSSSTNLKEEFSEHIVSYLAFIHKKWSSDEFNTSMSQLVLPPLVLLLQDIHTLGGTYGQNIVENAIDKLLSTSLSILNWCQSNITFNLKMDKNNSVYHFTVYKPFTLFLTDARLQSILMNLQTNDRNKIRKVDFTGCVLLGPKALEYSKRSCRNLDPDCVKRLLSNAQFCDARLLLKGGEIAINRGLLSCYWPDSEKLWAAERQQNGGTNEKPVYDFSKVDPQTMQDYIDFVIGYEDTEITALRLIVLFNFKEQYQLEFNEKMKTRFLLTATHDFLEKSNIDNTLRESLNTILGKIV